MSKHDKWISSLVIMSYTLIPMATVFFIFNTKKTYSLIWFDLIFSIIPLLFTLIFTWKIIWPRWKLIAKLVIHPSIYILLSLILGHWVILFAWIHQGVLGFGGHVWFSNKHGFKWYNIEDPIDYINKSKEMIGQLGNKKEKMNKDK